MRFIGAVGPDEFDRAARDHLGAEGIETRHLPETLDVATGTVMILIDASSGKICIALCAEARTRLSMSNALPRQRPISAQQRCLSAS